MLRSPISAWMNGARKGIMAAKRKRFGMKMSRFGSGFFAEKPCDGHFNFFKRWTNNNLWLSTGWQAIVWHPVCTKFF
jgi:hypothetical protein